jgi:hypothetical protein
MPCERLLESPDISEKCKAELRRRKVLNNPVELIRRLNEGVEKHLKLNREKGYAVRETVRPRRPDFG